MTVDQLGLVRHAARQIEEGQAKLVASIREARENGQSYRKIAAVAGVSHETVRRICEDE